METRSKFFIPVLLVLILVIVSTAAAPAALTTSAAESGEVWCNTEGVMTVLLLGTDHRSRTYRYGLADSIMVFRIDFDAPSVRVLSIPRDLWVYVPGIEDDIDTDHTKLNTAYLYGTEEMGFNPDAGGGAGLMALTLKENWGLEVDHTAVVSMTVFADVVRAIGGIEVYNPSPVYSHRHKNKPMYPAGGYFFDGKDAQLYARYRDPRNEVDRVDRHSVVIKAVIDSLFQPETVPHIPELISAYRDNVVTDLKLSHLSQLLCLASQRDEVDVAFGRIPKDDLQGTRTYFPPFNATVYNLVEKEEGRIEEIVSLFQAGEWPPDTGE